MAKTHNDREYIDMVKLMIESDRELSKILKEPSIAPLLEKECWVFFGPSRTGKSTLLNRIQSNDSQEDFLHYLNQANEEVTDKYLAKVGPGAKAVTTVPNVLVWQDKNGNSRLIFDLPGCIDVAPEREAVISILCKTLFPRLKSFKLLIILDLSFILSLTMTMTMYLHELTRLLSPENLKPSLNSCGFVFTKSDVYQDIVIQRSRIDKDDFKDPLKHGIKELLQDFVNQVLSQDMQLGLLTTHMLNNNAHVNYKNMGKDQVLDALSKVFEKIKPMDSSSMQFTLSTTQNILRDKGINVMEKYQQRITTHKTTIENILKNEEALATKLKTDIKASSLNKQEKAKLLKSYEESIAQNNHTLELNKKTITEANNAVAQLESDIKAWDEKYNIFKKDLQDLEILNTITLKSKLYKKKTYRILTDLETPPGSTNRFQVVVLDKKQYDRAKDLIDKCKNLKEFEELKLQFIYNAGQMMNPTKKTNIQVVASIGNSISVDIESEEEVVALCMTHIKITGLAQSEAMSGFFTNQMNAKRFEKKKKEDLAVSLSMDNLEIEKEIDSLDKKRIATTRQLSDIESAFSIIKTDFQNNKENYVNQYNAELDKLSSLLEEEAFILTTQLCQLLTDFKIEVSVFSQLVALKQTCQGLLSARNSMIMMMTRNISDINVLLEK